MQKIAWSEEFSVGVEKMDAQHKVLIGMINKLILDPQATTRSETVSDVLNEMTNYVQTHFTAEEALLAEHGYPQLKTQIQQHRDFQKTTAKFCTATAVDIHGVPDMLLEHLSEWLVHHILESDKAYSPFLKDCGVK
jgi:hemerythrin